MDNRVAVVTGGQGDLGLAIGACLRQSDYECLTPGRNELDVSQEESVRAFFSALGRIDLLVNSAGVALDGLLASLPEEDWDKVLQVNLRGAFLCSQAAVVGMAKRRAGHIINIGSLSARSGPVGQANYAAAKAGLIGLTQSMAREYGRRNIRCNCVLPGYLKTKFTASVSEETEARALGQHVLGRFNTPEDAARFIVTLDSMSHVSGQVFQLDSRIGRWT